MTERLLSVRGTEPSQKTSTVPGSTGPESWQMYLDSRMGSGREVRSEKESQWKAMEELGLSLNTAYEVTPG